MHLLSKIEAIMSKTAKSGSFSGLFVGPRQVWMEVDAFNTLFCNIKLITNLV